MSLRDLAALDHASILGDTIGAFSAPVTVRNPDGVEWSGAAMTCDVGQVVDPETGAAVVGRRVTVSLLLAPLRAAGLGDPRGVADTKAKPWLVRMIDSRGVEQTYMVSQAMPDDVFARVDCILEAYRPG